MKCANCDSPAEYSLTDPGVSPIDYCSECVPYHLRSVAGYGKMPLRQPTNIVGQPEGNVENVPVVGAPITEPLAVAKKRK